MQRQLRLQTESGPVYTRLLADGDVEVDMGVPQVTPFAVLDVDGLRVGLTPISMGNPHAVGVRGRCCLCRGAADRRQPAETTAASRNESMSASCKW